MYDLWVENVITKDCWRMNSDPTKEVYKDSSGEVHYKDNKIMNYKFYPCCPKEKPEFDTFDNNYVQLNIFNYINREEYECI